MTNDRPTTTDALAYLRDALHIHAADPGVWVDARTLSLALAEFAAARARVAALEALVREMLPHLEWTARFDEDQAALVKRARELVGGEDHDKLQPQ